jgi:hypothetical protein
MELLFLLNEKPTNALTIHCIGTQYSATCFVTLKCHQVVKHDPAEKGAQCRGKQRTMGAVYCDRRRDGRDIPTDRPSRRLLQYIEWLLHLLVVHSP